MQRAFYKGEAGFQRYVSFCVLAHNLVAYQPGRPKMNEPALPSRQRLLEQYRAVGAPAIHGTLSEDLPHLWQPAVPLSRSKAPSTGRTNISYRGKGGKTSGYYVPKAAESEVRRGVEARANSKHSCGSFPRSQRSAPSKLIASKNRRTFATGFS